MKTTKRRLKQKVEVKKKVGVKQHEVKKRRWNKAMSGKGDRVRGGMGMEI